jgi:hypothetical protein
MSHEQEIKSKALLLAALPPEMQHRCDPFNEEVFDVYSIG